MSIFRAAICRLRELFRATDTKIDRVLSIILIISFVLAISMTAYVINNAKRGGEVYGILCSRAEGKAADYPTNLKVREEGKVIIGVVNHECINVTCRLEVRLNEEVIVKGALS